MAISWLPPLQVNDVARYKSIKGEKSLSMNKKDLISFHLLNRYVNDSSVLLRSKSPIEMGGGGEELLKAPL